MTHIRDIQLIEYCSGRLPNEARAQIEAHLAACDDCAEKLRQTRQTWQSLGEWDTGHGQVDLASRVLEHVNANPDDLPDRGPYRIQDWAWPMAKLAASIGLAALLGHAAGLAFRPSPTNLTADAADPQQAASELYLDVMADDEPAGFVSVILPPVVAETTDEEA